MAAMLSTIKYVTVKLPPKLNDNEARKVQCLITETQVTHYVDQVKLMNKNRWSLYNIISKL